MFAKYIDWIKRTQISISYHDIDSGPFFDDFFDKQEVLLMCNEIVLQVQSSEFRNIRIQ